MTAIDDFLSGLNSGILALDSTHNKLECQLVRTGEADDLLEDGVDFILYTHRQWAEFALGNGAPYTSRVAEMPVSHNPDHPDLLKHGWSFWPIRGEGDCPKDITGLTIHHTLSHSPLALAQWTTRRQENGGKGYPTIQYHFWVSQGDGCPVWQLVPTEWAAWHDHTGAYQTALSIGMAGRLHESPPPAEQLEAAARLVAWLQERYNIPLEEVQGHCDRKYGTECPGWNYGWRDDFFEALNSVT